MKKRKMKMKKIFEVDAGRVNLVRTIYSNSNEQRSFIGYPRKKSLKNKIKSIFYFFLKNYKKEYKKELKLINKKELFLIKG